jgi:hypothetical protein
MKIDLWKHRTRLGTDMLITVIVWENNLIQCNHTWCDIRHAFDLEVSSQQIMKTSHKI